MKRLIPLFFLAFLFCSCQNEIKNWVILSVNTDNNTTFIQTSNSYYKSKVDADITISVSLLPEADDFIEVTKVYSSAPEILLIESIDLNKRIIKAKALKAGEAKIYVYTKSHSSASTLSIYIK